VTAGKGNKSRVVDRAKYVRNKERIFMSTWKLFSALSERLYCMGDPLAFSTVNDHRHPDVHNELDKLSYDVSRIMDDKDEPAKAVRTRIFELHEQLDELEQK